MSKALLLLCFVGLNQASQKPIIGILAQEMDSFVDEPTYDAFVAAAYVKFLESAGARVIPIWPKQTKEYYERVANYTNGILLPGGSAEFNPPSGGYEAAIQLYQLAIQKNEEGSYYPVWGTCLGMELLPFAQSGRDLRSYCALKVGSYPVHFVKNYRDSRLFRNVPKGIANNLSRRNVTFNYHSFCFTEKNFTEFGFLADWKILTTNKDDNNLEFISTMEHRRYPFSGVQFHPEAVYEYKNDIGFPHSKYSVKVTQYLANFFVEECRKNKHKFPSHNLEVRSLIYNYALKFTARQDAYYYQAYVFKYQDFRSGQLKKEIKEKYIHF